MAGGLQWSRSVLLTDAPHLCGRRHLGLIDLARERVEARLWLKITTL